MYAFADFGFSVTYVASCAYGYPAFPGAERFVNPLRRLSFAGFDCSATLRHPWRFKKHADSVCMETRHPRAHGVS